MYCAKTANEMPYGMIRVGPWNHVSHGGHVLPREEAVLGFVQSIEVAQWHNE